MEMLSLRAPGKDRREPYPFVKVEAFVPLEHIRSLDWWTDTESSVTWTHPLDPRAVHFGFVSHAALAPFLFPEVA